MTRVDNEKDFNLNTKIGTCPHNTTLPETKYLVHIQFICEMYTYITFKLWCWKKT